MARTENLKTEGMATFDSKAMLEENAEKGTKVTYSDRLKVEVIKATKYYREGDILEPHVVMAEALIKQGIARKVKE